MGCARSRLRSTLYLQNRYQVTVFLNVVILEAPDTRKTNLKLDFYASLELPVIQVTDLMNILGFG